jgi:hypothetical protein
MLAMTEGNKQGPKGRDGRTRQSCVMQEAGAGEGNRTPDLRFTKPLLYRLSYAGSLR